MLQQLKCFHYIMAKSSFVSCSSVISPGLKLCFVAMLAFLCKYIGIQCLIYVRQTHKYWKALLLALSVSHLKGNISSLLQSFLRIMSLGFLIPSSFTKPHFPELRCVIFCFYLVFLNFGCFLNEMSHWRKVVFVRAPRNST